MSTVARFGLFEVDLAAGKLRKQGRLVRLQQLPFELLRCLLARAGEIVTRDELRLRLWPADAIVDFDQSLNKSVTKLRSALGDSATSPRFVETLHKRGYRFIAPVTRAETDIPATATPESVTAVRAVTAVTPLLVTAVTPSMPPERLFSLRRLMPLAVMVGLAALLLNYAGSIHRANPPLAKPLPAVKASGTADAGAHDAYRRGRVALSRRTEDGLRSGVELFTRALVIDSRYAPAYVGLADAWSLLASYGVEDSREALERAREFATRALTINAQSAEAHASLGRTAMLADWDWRAAEEHFQRAITIQPDYATAHHWYAYSLSATGRHAEAERAARAAASLDPGSLIAATSVGYVLYAARRFDDAAAALLRVVEVDPDFMQARKNLGLVLMALGRHAEAISEFERVVRLSRESAVSLADLAWARGRAGDVTGARLLLARLEARHVRRYVPLDSLSLALAGAGQTDQAVATLNAAYSAKVAGLSRLAIDPRWDGLRDAPPVRAMADSIKAGVAR